MISVIVPIYNVQKYLSKCIKSILSQDYTDFELILVNDNSTDNSLEICNKFQSIDSRIIIINNPQNIGLDKTRFEGIKIAKGDFITFVDSDDWIAPHCLKKMINIATLYNTDLVIGNIKQVAINGLIKIQYYNCSQYSNRIISHDEIMKDYYISFFGYNILPCNAYAKLYRTSILKNSDIKPKGYKFGEDIMFNIKVFPLLKSMYIINDTLYYYRIGSGFTSKAMLYWMDTIKEEYNEKIFYINKYKFDNAIYYTKVELLNCLITYIESFIRFNKEEKKNNIAKIKKELNDTIYKELIELNNDNRFDNNKILNLILRKDASNLYNMIEYKYNHAPLLVKFKRFIRNILTIIQ